MAFRDLGRTSGTMNNTKRKNLWVTTRVCLACFDYPTRFNSFYSSLAKNWLDQASLPVENGLEFVYVIVYTLAIYNLRKIIMFQLFKRDLSIVVLVFKNLLGVTLFTHIT